MRSLPYTLTSFLLLTACGGGGSGTSNEVGLGGATSTGGSLSTGGTGGDGNGTSTGGKTGATGGEGNETSTGGKTGATGGNGTSTGGKGEEPPCKTSADCDGLVCDVESGACVECASEADCPDGSYCTKGHECVAGCNDAVDCADRLDDKLVCDTTNHTCVACTSEDDCEPGTVCAGTECVAGCSETHACAGTDTCCDEACVDVDTNLANCGVCGKACVPFDNATTECLLGACTNTCIEGFADCNGDPSDGCEHDVTQNGECVCTPGEVRECYDGAPGTNANLPCRSGSQTCEATGLGWGACIGQVLPTFDLCSNGVDDDCDGTIDNPPDLDGDGWTACRGDCCETSDECSTPSQVNPGAIELAGDGMDNDCDGTIDSVPTTTCSTARKLLGVTAMDAAQALDLCATTDHSPPPAQKKWGVISAQYFTANGTLVDGMRLTHVQNWQTAIFERFGNTITPRNNATMFALSTGRARDGSQSGWIAPVNGTDFDDTSIPFTTASGPLGAYLAHHDRKLISGTCGEVDCPSGTSAHDSLLLRLRIRVPTNAQSFSFDFRFISADYATFQCNRFNDHFLALLTSGAKGLPEDKNIAADADGRSMSVNSSFLSVCSDNGMDCGTCNGSAELAGTGFNNVSGGATPWLRTRAPVVPGEVITLDLMLFDVDDDYFDSLVLVDNFTWSSVPASFGGVYLVP